MPKEKEPQQRPASPTMQPVRHELQGTRPDAPTAKQLPELEQLLMEALEAWEEEGGARQSIPAATSSTMIGTVNQVDWAKQIKAQVNAEFDRVAKALELAASQRAEQDRADIRIMIAILEEKRAEVMANDQAGYFIHDWQELRDQVRGMIREDPRYKAIKARQARKQ
jgi:hypothetical protein